MATYSKELLSGSTDGRGIKVAATAIGTGTTIHTAPANAVDIDLVTLFAYNDSTDPVVLTLGWGGTTDPDDLIIQTIPAQSGLYVLCVNQPLRNSLVIKAAAGTANVITIHGSVSRIDK